MLFDVSGPVAMVRFVQGERSIPKALAWVGWISMAAFLAMLCARYGLLVCAGIAGISIAVPFVLASIGITEIGIYIMLLCAFFISIPNRLLEGIPMGIAIDMMIVLMMSGFLYRSAISRDWKALRTPASLAVLCWGLMNIAELVNPIAASRAAWFYVVRPAVEYMMLFFLTCHALSTRRKVIRITVAILILALFSACWGIYQANFGYFSWEYNYVVRHDLMHLVFNYGRWRAIGTIGSPSQFGIIMAFISTLSFSMYLGFNTRSLRYLFLVVSVATLLAMVYSGTRSAYVIIPVFYAVWVILMRRRKLYYSLLVVAGLFVILAVIPSQNYHIQRIQSTFKASEDASYQTRARNKAIIFPWIIKHPVGGGLGSTGIWGQRFSPGTFLASFPPDSGLVRVAVELGWIGLLLFLNVYYQILIKGTAAFWTMHDKSLRAIAAGIIASIAPLLIVEWGQEVVGVFPMSMLFWIFAAILFRCIQLDSSKETGFPADNGKDFIKQA